MSGVETFDSSSRVAGTAFLSDITRGYEQKAVFSDVAFDLLPHVVDLDGGNPFLPFRQFRSRTIGLGLWVPEHRSLRSPERHLRPVQFLAGKFRSQEQSDAQLEGLGWADALRHLLRGIQARRLQSRGRPDPAYLAALRKVLGAALLRQRHLEELRDRLEDAVVRSPASVRRSGVRRGMVRTYSCRSTMRCSTAIPDSRSTARIIACAAWRGTSCSASRTSSRSTHRSPSITASR